MNELVNQQLLVKHYKDEVKREATGANIKLLENARSKLMEMKQNEEESKK